MSRVAREVVVAPIRLYQHTLARVLRPRCQFAPSCTEYAVQAVRQYGILRGLVLAGWRLLRCNPLNAGGLDPVSAQRLFRSSAPSRGAEGRCR